MSQQVNVVALCRAKPGRETETRETLEAVAAPTRLEPGCLRYTLHVDRAKPGDFWFYETWESQDALDQHMSCAATAVLIDRLDDLLAEPATLLTLTPLA